MSGSDEVLITMVNNSFNEAIDKLQKSLDGEGTGKKNPEVPEGVTVSKSDDPVEEIVDLVKDLGLNILSIKENSDTMLENQANDKEDFAADKGGLAGIAKEANDAAGGDGGAGLGAGGGKASPTPTNKLDIAELKQLDLIDGLGFAVLYWKLDEIEKKMGGGEDEGGKKGKGIGGFFSGLLKGVSGIASIALALVAFAGAIAIFNFIDWGPAIGGLVSFAAFTLGIVALSKELGKEQKSLKEFAEASILMSAALGVFALGLLIASNIFSGKPTQVLFFTLPAIDPLGAVLALVTFGAFVTGLAFLSKVVKRNGKSFKEFAKASVIMSGALAAFAVALYVTGAIIGGEGVTMFGKRILPPFDIGSALLGTGIFLVFITALAAISLLVGANGESFKQFASASLTMSLALAAFAVSLYITGAIVGGEGVVIGGKQILPPFDLASALLGTGIFIAFIAAMAGVAILATSILPMFMTFALASLTLAGALGLFAISIALVGVVVTGEGGKVGFIEMPKIAGGGWTALAGIGLFTAFIAAMGALAIAAGLLIIPLGIGSAAILMISGTTMLMAKALSSAAAVVNGGVLVDENGKEETTSGLDQKGVELFFTTFGYFTDEFKNLFGELKALKQAKDVAKVLQPVAECVGEIANALIASAEAGKVSGDIESALVIFDKFRLLSAELGAMPIQECKDAKTNAKHIKPVAEVVGLISNTLIESAQAAENVSDENINKILNMFGGDDGSSGFMAVVLALGNMANNMSKKSAKILQMVSEAMVPMTQSIGNLVHIMDEAAALGQGGEKENVIPDALAAINRIMLGDEPGKGFIDTFMKLGEKVQDMGKKQLEALPMLDPVVTAISKLVEVTTEAGTIDSEVAKKGQEAINAATDVITSIVDTFDNCKKLITPKRLKPIVGFLQGSDEYEGIGIASVIEAVNPITEAISKVKDIDKNFIKTSETLTAGVNKLSGMKGKGIENLASMSESIKKLSTSDAEALSSVMSNFQKGITDLNAALAVSNPFSVLEENAVNFGEALENVNDMITKLIRKKGDIDKLSDKMKDLRDNAKAAEKKVSSTMAKADPIYEILNRWDTEGVLVKSREIKGEGKKQATPVIFSI